MEILAASHFVENIQGDSFVVREMWRTRGWLGLVAEIRFCLDGGESVEQLADNAFVISGSDELLTSVTAPSSEDCVVLKPEPETLGRCADEGMGAARSAHFSTRYDGGQADKSTSAK